MAAVGGVAGLAFEARIASGREARLGGDGRTLAASVASAIAGDCRGLISFGIAGGLAPGLCPGTCLVGSTIITETVAFATDWNWSRNLLRLIPGAIHGAIVGLSPPVLTRPDAERGLHRRTGALVVDNESHGVARIAADRGVPAAAVRVVLDPASRELPRSAVDAMRPDETIDLAVLVGRLLRDPSELPLPLRIAADAVARLAALLCWRPLLGPGLGLPGLQAARHPAPPSICGLERQSLEHT